MACVLASARSTHLLVDLLRGLGITEGHRGHVLQDGHLHGAVPAVQQCHQRPRVQGPVHDGGTDACKHTDMLSSGRPATAPLCLWPVSALGQSYTNVVTHPRSKWPPRLTCPGRRWRGVPILSSLHRGGSRRPSPPSDTAPVKSASSMQGSQVPAESLGTGCTQGPHRLHQGGCCKVPAPALGTARLPTLTTSGQGDLGVPLTLTHAHMSAPGCGPSPPPPVGGNPTNLPCLRRGSAAATAHQPGSACLRPVLAAHPRVQARSRSGYRDSPAGQSLTTNKHRTDTC